MQRRVYPEDLLTEWDAEHHAGRPDRLIPRGPVSWDTETSGLWVDAGARVSTVSVAFIVPDWQVSAWSAWLGGGDQHLWDDGIWTLRKEMTSGARSSEWARGEWVKEEWVLSFAWPFDQGAIGTGKPEDTTDAVKAAYQGGMLGALDWDPPTPEPDSGNLDGRQWGCLIGWLAQVGKMYGLIAHNAKFDVHQTGAGVRRWPGVGVDLLPYVIWDTSIGSDIWLAWRMADRGKPTTQLKPNGQWIWGDSEGDEKTVISKYLKKKKLPTGRWDLMPWRIVAKYADQDARLTIRYYVWQVAEQARVKRAIKLDGAPEKGWTAGASRGAFERRMDTMRMLTKVERRGVPFNVEGAREASVELARRQDEVEQVLAAKLGGKVTLDMLKHYWFGTGTKDGEKGQTVWGLEHEPYGLTKTGQPVVDIATLAKARRDGLPLVNEWIAFKKLGDARSRWYDGWADRAGPDGRLRAGFRQNGTASGRFSVENLQLQAIPADYKVRGILEGIPSPRDLIGQAVPEGYDLWEMDLAQAELRVAASMAGCHKMLSAIDEGRDLHGETAIALFGITPDDPDWGMYRQVAKRGNFSLIFGVGAETFQATLWKEAEVDWELDRVKAMIYAWNDLYPEYKTAIRKHEAVAMNRYAQYGMGWIDIGKEQGLNERRWFTKWDVEYFNPRTQRLEEGAHKAFNQRVQPTLAQYGIDRWLAEEKYLSERYRDDPYAGLVLMVHDSSVLLLPTGDGPEVTSTLAEMGTDLWRKWFGDLPGAIDVSAWAAHA